MTATTLKTGKKPVFFFRRSRPLQVAQDHQENPKKKERIQTMTNNIRTNANCLKRITILGPEAKSEYVQNLDAYKTEANTGIQALYQEQAARLNTEAKLFSNTHTVYQPQNLQGAAENAADMLEGCLNRMCVTDDPEELHRLANSAFYRIHALHQLALFSLGRIALPERPAWRVPTL